MRNDGINYNEALLFYLVRAGLGTERNFDFKFTEMPQWEWIYEMSAKQGVLAIVFDGIKVLYKRGIFPKEYDMCIDLKLAWKYNTLNMERTIKEKFMLEKEFAEEYAARGIRMVVLKGIAIAMLYPKASHRPCGDLDCFMMGDYEKGNTIAPEIGAVYEGCDTKHSHIRYKGLEIENHQFCTPVCGNWHRKEFERRLQSLLYGGELKPIGSSKLYYPDAMFSALFLTVHSWRHYIDEGIFLRHITDWVLLLEKHFSDIDWDKFVETIRIRDEKIMLYAGCLSLIAHRHLGAKLPPIFKGQPDEELISRMLRSILYDEKPPKLNRYDFITRKFVIIWRSLKSNWKIRTFCSDHPVTSTFMMVYNRLFELHPKI